MCGVTGAIIGGGIIGAGASYLGSKKQAGAAQDAANLSMDQFNVLNEQQQPFIQSGYGAQSKLNQLLGIKSPQAPGTAQPLSYGDWMAANPGYSIGVGGGFDPAGFANQAIQYQNYVNNFQPAAAEEESANFGSLLKPFDAAEFTQYKDPGYQFRLQQGTQGLQNSAAASSGALSGAALKDLIGYNQDMASTEYGNAFNRYQTQQGNIFSRLSSLATLGQNAAANVGAQGTQLAGQAGQAISNAGTAAGAGIVGVGNALSNAGTNYWLSKMAGSGP